MASHHCEMIEPHTALTLKSPSANGECSADIAVLVTEPLPTKSKLPEIDVELRKHGFLRGRCVWSVTTLTAYNTLGFRDWLRMSDTQCSGGQWKMPENPDQLTDDELWTSFGNSLDVLQDLPIALEYVQKELKDVIQEMSAASLPEADTWLQRLCRLCNEQPPQQPESDEEQHPTSPNATPEPEVAASAPTVIPEPVAETSGSPNDAGSVTDDAGIVSIWKRSPVMCPICLSLMNASRDCMSISPAA
jgi:hypothetical protein